MKKRLAIYLAALAVLFTGVSCDNSDESTVVLSPYAMVTSFSLGNIKSSYHAFTSTGEDTTVVRTIYTGVYPFTIDQLSGEIFNADSLPFGTDVSKLVISMGLKGYACMYNDSTATFEYFNSTDSIDFSKPRRFRIYSADTEYERDYTVRVNVHQVAPELLSWNKYGAPAAFVPSRAIEYGGEIKLYGTAANASLSVASAPVGNDPAWAVSELSGLPATAELSNIQQFAGNLYAVAEGNLYTSANAVDWSVAVQDLAATAIVGVSGENIWVAGEQGIKVSSDGVTFELSEELPAGFPLYGLSLASYRLVHNANITRYMLIGYTTAEKNGPVAVWSCLSNEGKWVHYDNGNGYACPALAGLSVLRYDDKLFAFGGEGVVAGESVEALSTFFVSKDNGIVWKASDNFYQRLPKELSGNVSQFAATVDSENFMWIVTSGENAGAWRGIINRLGF